jgi:presenilin-like A22 family membrane protease
MRFDVILSLILFFVSLITLFLYEKYAVKVNSLFGENKFRTRDAVLMVLMMGTMVTVIAFIPQRALMVLFLFVYVLLLFLFTYVISPKWYLAILPPALFLLFYFFYWNIYLSDIFAIVFVVSISLFLGGLFTWKSTIAFVTLLVIMDILQVLVTQHMVVSAEKMLELQLPTMIIVPTFPLEGQAILGLGDILLTSLLSIQTLRKYGKRFGIVSCMSIAIVFLLVETLLLNYAFGFFPATVMIASGWLIVLITRYINKKYGKGDFSKIT